MPKSTLLRLDFSLIFNGIGTNIFKHTWLEHLELIYVEGMKYLSFGGQKLEAIRYCGAKFVEQPPQCLVFKIFHSSFEEQTGTSLGLNLSILS